MAYRLYVPRRAERVEKAKARLNAKLEWIERRSKEASENLAHASAKLASAAQERQFIHSALSITEAHYSARAGQARAEIASIRAWTISSALAANLAGLWSLLQLDRGIFPPANTTVAVWCFVLGTVTSFISGQEDRHAAKLEELEFEERLLDLSVMKLPGEYKPPDHEEKSLTRLRARQRPIWTSLARFIPIGLFLVGLAVMMNGYDASHTPPQSPLRTTSETIESAKRVAGSLASPRSPNPSLKTDNKASGGTGAPKGPSGAPTNSMQTPDRR